MNLNRKSFALEVAGRELKFELSQLAQQATAAVTGSYGETTVLVTVVMDKEDKDIDYLPLVVDYEERFYAVGKILGSRFVRREGKSSDEAILSGRLIDRTIRPLFNHQIRRDIQIVVTVLQADGENDADFVALMTTSVALAISEIPWGGPVAGVRIAKFGDKLLVNPTVQEMEQGLNNEKYGQVAGNFEIFVAGPNGKINMIEMEGREAKEEEVLEACARAQKEIDKLIKFQEEIAEKIGAKKVGLALMEDDQKLAAKMQELTEGRLEKAMFVIDKKSRLDNLDELKKEVMRKIEEEYADDKELAMKMAQSNHIFESLLDELVHEKIIGEGERPDGRKTDELRELYSEAGLFKRLHGSALFIRGQTQSMAATTLASPEGAQMIETMEFSGKKRFMLHYNFPPFSTGEVGRMRGPGRREIGHGSLAEKAVRGLIPAKADFPYAIRVVSEILSSNGSSSMASVCGASLSLMDAGVPIKKHVAGIAMGLMIDKNGEYKVLTDIQGPEDHHGDMDFKVAGTIDGITAIQLDVKIEGLTQTIIKDTLTQARKARLEIIEHLNKTIAQPREKLSPYAPRVLIVKIDPEKIGLVIGPGGKTINGIIAKTGAGAIDIDEDGTVYISAEKAGAAEEALRHVEAITHEYKIGDIVEGKVVKILEFGAIVEFAPETDGMIHISELKEGFVQKVQDVVKEGDFVRAKIIKAEGGKIGLTLRGVK